MRKQPTALALLALFLIGGAILAGLAGRDVVTSKNEVRLRQSKGRWRVVGWTVIPGGATPGSGF